MTTTTLTAINTGSHICTIPDHVGVDVRRAGKCWLQKRDGEGWKTVWERIMLKADGSGALMSYFYFIHRPHPVPEGGTRRNAAWINAWLWNFQVRHNTVTNILASKCNCEFCTVAPRKIKTKAELKAKASDLSTWCWSVGLLGEHKGTNDLQLAWGCKKRYEIRFPYFI